MKRTLLYLVLLSFVFNAQALTIYPEEPIEFEWPENIREWYVGMDPIAYQEIVFYQDGFYRCEEEDGTFAYSEGWSPKSDWATPVYTFMTEGRRWVENMGAVAFEEYVAWAEGIYQCTNTEGTEAWGDGWSPTGWNSTSYTKVAGFIPDPNYGQGDDNILPENYVGRYQESFSWLVDFTTVYEYQVYTCIADTHVDGGENPGTNWGYWSAAIGDEKNLLSLVTLPTWDDDREWPVGAIVAYTGEGETEEKYYECIAKTHKEGGEHPQTTWGYWKALELGEASIDDVTVGMKYTVRDGLLELSGVSGAQIVLYDVTGRLVGKANTTSIQLPQRGIYIAKVSADGKTESIKILW